MSQLFTVENLLGLGISLVLTGGLAMLVSSSRLPRKLKQLLYVGLGLRVAGAFARYGILWEVYGGVGDAVSYYERGLAYARRFWAFDFSPFWDRSQWLRGGWTETSFISFPSGVVLTFIGPSMLGEFVVFSLLAFGGLASFALAFHRSYPDIPVQNYARWIWLFPSLWFWPASVGKEALLIMGIGLAVAGFIGRRGKVQWSLLIVGLFFVYAIRSEVAVVLIASFFLSQWLAFGGRWTPSKIAQGVAIAVTGLVGMYYSLQQMGVEGFDVEGVQQYMVANEALSETGSTVDRVGLGVGGVPMAIVNILTRPWPWEATNAMALISALEIVGLWSIVYYRRKNLKRALRTWRSHPLLRIAIPFILVYSVALGMLIVNLGIIARQRVLLFPFFFLLLEATPAVARRRSLRRRPPPPGPVRTPYGVGPPPPGYVAGPVR